MMKKRLASALLGIGLVLLAPEAQAWWDTWVRNQTSEPCLMNLQAKDMQGAKDIRTDPQANAAKGGPVVFLKPGEGLTFKAELRPSVYDVWLIARADEKDYTLFDKKTVEVELQGEKTHFSTIRPPILSFVQVRYANGKTERWAVPVPYSDTYGIVSKLYFPVHAAGATEITVGLDAQSQKGLLVNRVELRDVLGLTVKQAFKNKRLLTSDEELAGIRKAYAEKPKKRKAWRLGRREFKDTYALPAKRSADERRRAADKLWDSLPDWNTVACVPAFRTWHHVIGRDCKGKVLDLAEIYEQTNNSEAGWDAAVMLCALAEKYPGLDHYYQYVGSGPHHRLASKRPLSWGQSMGKSVYSGWAGGDLSRLATAYDKVFDAIQGNQALADYVHTRIDWVKTPKDVIQFLDVYLLQHGIDCVNRQIIRNDPARKLCRHLLNIPPEAKLPEKSVFARPKWAEDEDDVAFCDRSRGGVTYIGSTLYVGYGEPKNYLCCAGGFPTIVGDAMDQGRNRAYAKGPEYPSRVYEGFGEVILEDGLGQLNARLRRALAIHTGIGRGHAHQDTLNLELFAHGCRLMPDLGGRHAGKRHSKPNMRSSRMHNMVVVDDRDFTNTFPGSTISATGWTTSFSPQLGSQYTCNAGRATSHRAVKVYERATAMIDGRVTEEDADIYVFDVFRVQGGKEHTYCMHGAWSDSVKTNANLQKAVSEEAARILRKRPEATRQEGACPDPLIMTWPLKPDKQKHYQGEFHQPDKPVGLTLTLFGRGRDRVYLGHAESPTYPVDLPYLHVNGKQDTEGRVSIFPAIFEAHAGPRFITAAKQLQVTPHAANNVDAGVAVTVSLGERQDLLFNSRAPTTAHTIEDGSAVTGEFAFLSRDAAGVRAFHLVGGTLLTQGDVRIECERSVYETKIKSVDYAKRGLTLAEKFPAKLLDGQDALLGNPKHWDTFQIASIADVKATVVKDPCYYQSTVQSVQGNVVTAEVEPKVFGSDTDYCLGTTISNEKGDRFWKGEYAPQERWMYLGWPNTDLSYPRIVRLEDVPDADGDGRRVLKLMASGGYNHDLKMEEPAGTVMLELEVTRVDPANFMFFFKMPKDLRYQTGGWQFANRKLVNEDGSKTWWATYPGTTYTWTLEGEVGPDAFPDMDQDGRSKMRAFSFGPGDTLSLKTFVYAKREKPGLFRVKANAACTLTLPGSAAEISADGRRFKPIGNNQGKSVVIPLSAADLGSGQVWLRIK